MKMTAGEFIGLLNRQGIECRIHRGRIVLTGEECDMLNSLRAVLKGNPSFERRIVRHIEEATRMTAGEYLRECENAGVMLQIDTWGSDIDMAGGNERTRARLCNILTREPLLPTQSAIFGAPSRKITYHAGKSGNQQYLRTSPDTPNATISTLFERVSGKRHSTQNFLRC